MEGKRARVAWLDTAKGLGILLVVIGHLVAEQLPAGWQCWAYFKLGLYTFHMPFFLAVSGYTCVAFGKTLRHPDFRFGQFARGKFMRLMVPHFLFAALIFGGKWAASRAVHVDNALRPGSSFWDVWTNPMESYSIFLWYVYMLFLFSLAAPLLAEWSGRWLAVLAVAAGGLLLAHHEGFWQAKMLVRAIVQSFPWLLAGAALARGRGLEGIDRWGWLAAAPFAALVWAGWANYARTGGTSHRLDLAAGMCGAVFALWAALRLSRKTETGAGRALAWLGGFAFPIYLMNTLCIGAAKAALLKLTPWDGWRFLLFLPVLFAAGLLVPIVLQTRVIERLPLIRNLLKR